MIANFILIFNTFGVENFNYYNFLENIDDLYFEIKSDKIESLINQKIPRNNEEFKAHFYWYKGALDIKIEGLEDVSLDIKLAVKKMLLNKVAIFNNEKFEDWLRPLEKEDEDGLYIKYVDQTGLSDLSELLVRRDSDELQIIEKKPIGTSKTYYGHKKFKWSKGLDVISEVNKSVYEGAHFIKTKSVIEYKQIRNKYWLPVKINVNSEQGGAILNYGDMKRVIDEEYEFQNFAINEEKAKKYFSLSN